MGEFADEGVVLTVVAVAVVIATLRVPGHDGVVFGWPCSIKAEAL